MSDLTLSDLIRRAQSAYDAMTPEQQAAMREAQRRSWVVAEMMMGPEWEGDRMTREEAEALYDKMARK